MKNHRSQVKTYNPRTHQDTLLVEPISQAAAKQRQGRAGRTRAGKCYRLYTKAAHDQKLKAVSVPEIARTNLGSAILTLFSLGVEDVVHFDWMTPPAPEAMMRALELLLSLGAVDEEGNLTATGGQMAQLPLDPQFGAALLKSAEYGVSDDMAAIIAMLSGAPPHMRPRQYAKAADRAHRQFTALCGDHGSLLNIFKAYQTTLNEGGKKTASTWAYDNYLKDRSLQSAISVQKQLVRMLGKFGIQPSLQEDAESASSALRRSLVAGFFLHVAFLGGGGKHYVTCTDKQIVHVHPGSCLEHKPEWILYNELVTTDKSYCRNVSAVRAPWLLQEAPGFFPDAVKQNDAREALEREAAALARQKK